MLPETRELFRAIIKGKDASFGIIKDWVGNDQLYVKTMNGGNDNYLTVRIDNKGGYQVLLKRHGVDQLMDSHTGETIASKGLKGHQEKQDRDLAVQAFKVVNDANLQNYKDVVNRIIK